MHTRKKTLIQRVTGTIDRAEMTDRGIRYSGADDNGEDFSADVEDFRMAILTATNPILMEGDYLVRDSNDRKFVICDKKDNVFIDLAIGDDGRFVMDYGRMMP